MMPGTSNRSEMEASAEGVLAVCPPEETLRVGSRTNVKCGVPGCERVFAQMSARRFHMVKVHKIIESDQDAALEHHGSCGTQRVGVVHYYCPVPKCKYTPQLGRYFTSMKNLNQHYRHVHAEKKYKCSQCGHGFGELRGQVRHEKTCGLKFLCLQCSNIYNTKDALQTHCTRTGHRSGFSAINNIVFRDAVNGDNCVAAPVQEIPAHPAERTTPVSTLGPPTKIPSIATHPHQIPDALKLPITDDSAKTTSGSEQTLVVTHAPSSQQMAEVHNEQLVTEQSVNTEPCLSRPQYIAEISEVPPQKLITEQSLSTQQNLSRPQQQVVEISQVPHQNHGTDQSINTQSLCRPQQQVVEISQLPHQNLGTDQSINTQQSLSRPQQQVVEVSEVPQQQQLTTVVPQSGQPKQSSATLNHPLPASSQQQEIAMPQQMPEISHQQLTRQTPLHPEQSSAILSHHDPISASSEQQEIPRSQQLQGISNQESTPQQSTVILYHPSQPSLSVEQETPAANPEEASLPAPRTTLPLAPAYILPKPDALYMPVQLQINRENMIYGGQSGPVILIVNNAPPPEPPKRLKPLAPKVTREIGSQSRLRTVCRNDSSEAVVGMAREMEVQTEESQRYHQVVSTSSLSIQTMPCPMLVDMTSGELTQKVAETQTVYPPQFVVETQSKSSQVSPNAKLMQLQMQDGSTRITSKNPAPRGSRQKRKKQAEAGSQTRNSKSSDNVWIIPKKQKGRQKVCKTSVKGVRKQSHGQSLSSIVEAIGTNEMYCSNSGSLPLSTQTEGMLSTHRVSAAVGTAPELPQFESVGVGTMSSPLNLNDMNLSEQPVMVSVSTDMSRANTSVGTMPSPPLPDSNSYSSHFTPVSMNTIGTDPLPGFSGSSKDLNLSSVFSQETQTSFWAEFQASFAESNATQTMESYLADSGMNGDPLNMPSLMESGVQTCHAQNSQTQTWPTADTVSVGVGTSLLNQPHSPTLFEGMENDGLSRSIGIDTQLFDDLFPEVSSRSVAISTPLLDGMDNSQQSSGMESAMFRPIGQSRSVGVSPVGQHDLSDLDCLSRSNEGQTAASCQTTLNEGQYECIATASVQTDTDFELPVFLTAASQTSTYDPSLTHMETQTVDMFSQLLSNMETQTSTDILAELNFADIETQTTMSPAAPPQALTSVETQTAPILAATGDSGSSSGNRMSVYIDTETQTRLPNLHLTEHSLTDSHTQTTVEQFTSLVDELEKS